MTTDLGGEAELPDDEAWTAEDLEELAEGWEDLEELLDAILSSHDPRARRRRMGLGGETTDLA